MSKLPTIDELKSQISYKEYLTTKEWKDISDECRKLHNNKCNRCDNTKNLQAHHKHYDNIGNENQEDLECLCIECHSKEHDRDISEMTNKKSFKRGWYMQYKDYDDMLAIVVKSNRDIQLINHLKMMIDKDFFLHINITKEAKKVNVGRDKLSKLISALVDAKFLFRTDTGFIANSFMYLPYMARNVLEKQNEWKELMEGVRR